MTQRHPRMLFNPAPLLFGADAAMKKKGYRYKLTPRSGGFEPLYAKTAAGIADLLKVYRDETFAILDLETGRHFKQGPRALFNPEQSILPHGKIVIEQLRDKRRRPPTAYHWMVYLATTFTHGERAGRRGFWGPADSGIRLKLSWAREDAKKAYSRLVRTAPRTLF